jgi:hypothetical protein
MRHWFDGSDTDSVLAGRHQANRKREEIITWLWSVVMKMVARDETYDEVAAFLSGAVEMASAQAGTPARSAPRGLARRGERDAPRRFTARGSAATPDPGYLRRGHPGAGDSPGVRLQRRQRPAVGGPGPGIWLDDRRRAASPDRRSAAPRAGDRMAAGLPARTRGGPPRPGHPRPEPGTHRCPA